jgi:hypothetical protein
MVGGVGSGGAHLEAHRRRESLEAAHATRGAAIAAMHAGDRHRRQRPADDVDEERRLTAGGGHLAVGIRQALRCLHEKRFDFVCVRGADGISGHCDVAFTGQWPIADCNRGMPGIPIRTIPAKSRQDHAAKDVFGFLNQMGRQQESTATSRTKIPPMDDVVSAPS